MIIAQSCPTLCEPWTIVHQDPLSMEFSPCKYNGVSCHSLLQGIFPTQGKNTGLLHGRQILYHLSLLNSIARCINISECIFQIKFLKELLFSSTFINFFSSKSKYKVKSFPGQINLPLCLNGLTREAKRKCRERKKGSYYVAGKQRIRCATGERAVMHSEDELGRQGNFDSALPGLLAGLASSRNPICIQEN